MRRLAAAFRIGHKGGSEPPHSKEIDVYSDWTTRFFHGLAIEFWDAIAPQPTDAEIDFLRATFGRARELLDVACGGGRFAIPLAATGYQLTGIDRSNDFLDLARQRAPHIEWHHGDIREIPWTDRFEGALCFGNSFAYFPADETRTFLRGLARALKDRAPFVLETSAVAEVLLPAMQERREMEAGKIRFLSTAHYDANDSRLDTRYTFEKGGRSETSTASTWVFTMREVIDMLRDSGFGDATVYASAARDAFKPGSPRAILVTRKRRFSDIISISSS